MISVNEKQVDDLMAQIIGDEDKFPVNEYASYGRALTRHETTQAGVNRILAQTRKTIADMLEADPDTFIDSYSRIFPE